MPCDVMQIAHAVCVCQRAYFRQRLWAYGQIQTDELSTLDLWKLFLQAFRKGSHIFPMLVTVMGLHCQHTADRIFNAYVKIKHRGVLWLLYGAEIFLQKQAFQICCQLFRCHRKTPF